MFSSHYRFLIVGAGISGLRAAQILAENQQDFVVLQADDRIGGRICTLTIGQALAEDKIDCQFQWLNKHIKDLPIQCGATWLSQEQPVMRKIVKDFGLTMFSHYYQGSNIMALNPRSPSTHQHLQSLGQYYKLHLPKIQKLLNSMQKLQQRLKTLSINKKNGNMTEAEKKQLDFIYEKYDSMNAYDYILAQIQDQFLAKLLSHEVATLNCAKSEDYSVLTLMAEDGFANIKFYVGAQGCNIDGFRLKQGMSTIVNKMKDHIDQLNKKSRNAKKHPMEQFIRLNSPVVQIRNDSSPVQVITKSGEKFTCDKVIIAVPIATMQKIKFTSISKGKRLILENQLMGNMARQAMIFKQPFWRKLNKSGYVSFSHEFPMNELVDLTPCDSQCGILGFVFTADGWAKWKDQIAQKYQEFNGSELKKREYEMLQKESFKILADLFLDGNVEHEYLKEMVTFTRSFSTKPYIVAAYQATPALGVFKQVNALGEDIEDARFSDEKNVIILGSDFSTEFRGFMEGAVRIAELKIPKLLKYESLRQSRL